MVADSINTRILFALHLQDHPDLDTADIKLGDIYVRTQNAAGRRPLLLPKQAATSKKAQAAATAAASATASPIKVESDAIKVESEIAILANNETPTYDLPTLDTQNINLTQSYLNDSDQVAALEAIKFEEDNDENVEVKVELKMETMKTEPPKQQLSAVIPTKTNYDVSAIGGETKGKKRQNATSIHAAADRSPKKPLMTPNTTSVVKDEPTKVEPTISISYSAPNVPSPIMQLQPTPPTAKKVEKRPSVDMPTVAATTTMVTVPMTGTVTIANYSGKQVKAATMSDLEGIDMMHLPVDLDDSGGNIDILNDIVDMKPELIKETHACFLSLIRDIFCSTPDHRTTAENLHARVSTWLANPITALNDWFSQTDSWLTQLTSAIHFLAGEFIDQPDEFVPYVEYKAHLHIYQWIGAGRDSDQHLRPLCEYWLKRRNEMGTKPPPKHSAQNETSRGKHYASNIDPEDSLSSGGGANSSSFERIASPPPPRFPTEWGVQKESSDEIDDFRDQERKRFDNPHLSFTYRMHGYESVVGPVKGIYTQIPALTKARGHNMLTADRPNFVTILTLVRDATARLPNGEGTRADICELLKSSQYICPTAAENVLQTIVSGALDRMHTEHDPCVRYDAKRKIWIYLHRNRTEEEFDRMHQQYQGHSKHKKQTTRKNKSVKTVATLSQSPNEILSTDANAFDHRANVVSPSIVAAKKKCIAKIAMPAASISSTAAFATATATAAQIQYATSVVSSAVSPPLPALSTIQVSPTTVNKMITIQKKAPTKPELVPIKATHEPLDVGAPLDVSTSSPINVQKVLPRVTMPLPSLIVDKTSKIGAPKTIGKPTLNLIASNSTQIKVSTPSGIQTVHVSAAGHALIKPPMTTILTPSNSQSILSVNQVQNRPQSPLRVAKIQQQPQLKVQPPPLIAQSTPPNVSSYMIPISLSKAIQSASIIKSVSPIATQTTIAVAPKITKTTIPALTNAQMPRMSLLQTQQPQQQQSQNVNVSLNKTIIRSATAVPAGKSLISPLLQQHALPPSTSTVQIIQTKPLQTTQKFIMTSPVGAKTNLVTTSQANAPMIVQKLIAVSKASATSTASSSPVGTITPPGTSLINPHIIQIHQTNQKSAHAFTGTPTKLQTVSTANLTPAQQQNLLQSLKQQQQLRSQNTQQSLIIKQQQVLQQIQKQMQQSTTQIQLTSQAKGGAGTSLLGTQIQLTTNPSTSMIITGGTTTQPTITRPLKAGTSLIQQHQTNQTTTTSQITTSPITAVRTVSANSPLVGKVLTDASGQIISLESLLQKQSMAVNSTPTLRLTGTKPGQTTNLIQLTGTPGSQITQYAVVSQGRNLISMGQPRVITTQATGLATSNAINSSGNVVTVSGAKTTSGISVLSSVNAAASNAKTDIVKIGGRSINTHHLVNAKVLGMQGYTTQAGSALAQRVKTATGTSIRMVNASNLNITHIGGKPVIIASKTPTTTIINQSQNQTIQHNQSSMPNRTNVIWTQGTTSTGNTNFVIGGQTVKVQGNVTTVPFDQTASATTNVQSLTAAQNVMFGNQIVKLQAHQPSTQHLQTKTIVSSVGTSPATTTSTRTVVLSSTGQTIKVHTPTVISSPSAIKSAGGKVTMTTSTLPSTQQVVLGPSNIKV